LRLRLKASFYDSLIKFDLLLTIFCLFSGQAVSPVRASQQGAHQRGRGLKDPQQHLLQLQGKLRFF
jgi:hypothetical protein